MIDRPRHPVSITGSEICPGAAVSAVDIDTDDRSLSWYTLRHSTGTYLIREEGLAATQAQLRYTVQKR